MGYWKCPKCGSNDTYQGTEIVSEHKQGKSVGFENEFGIIVSQNVSGGTSHKQITVTKCRSCDTLLGEKDYHLTAEEQQQRQKQQQAQYEREQQAWPKVTELWTKVPFTKAYYSAHLPIPRKRKIAGWISLVIGVVLIASSYPLNSWLQTSHEWRVAYELAQNGFQAIEGTDRYEPISWYNHQLYIHGLKHLLFLGACFIFVSVAMLLFRRRKPQSK